jgi:hypothetical protein
LNIESGRNDRNGICESGKHLPEQIHLIVGLIDDNFPLKKRGENGRESIISDGSRYVLKIRGSRHIRISILALIDTEGVEPVSHLGIHILKHIVYTAESAIVIQERREVVVEFI